MIRRFVSPYNRVLNSSLVKTIHLIVPPMLGYKNAILLSKGDLKWLQAKH